MAEAEWLACTDARRLLHFTTERSGRKLRLFACNCCYSVWHLLEDQRSRRAVEVAELFADGFATNSELHRARHDAQSVFYRENSSGLRAGCYNSARAAHAATKQYPNYAAWDAAYESGLGLYAAEQGADPNLFDEISLNPFRPQHADRLRDVFGPLPFHPVVLESSISLLNSDWIRKLAQAIYDDRRFEDLPILADALEEAGCQDQSILDHLRSPGPHVRGCWPLDLILGRA